MHKKIILLLIPFLLLSFSAHAINSGKYFEQTSRLSHEDRYMTGDWNGMRTRLSNKGVDFTSSYVCDILGNPVGGKSQGVRYDHSVGLDVNVDFEKAYGIKGSRFHVSGLYRSGYNLSSEVIGNTLVVSSIFGHEQFRFYALTLEQLLCEEKLSFLVGRMGAQDEFIKSPLYWAFVTNAIDGMPINIPINFTFPVYPTATWGARVKVNITDEFSSMTGAYNGDPDIGKDSYHGFDFGLRLSKGALLMQEFNYTPRIKSEECPEGLPGRIMLGGYWNTGTFRDLYSDINGASYEFTGLSQKKHIGNYGVYLHLEQMLYREPDSDVGNDQGLTPFIAANFAPPNINKLPLLVMGGFVYTGPFPGRDYDTAAIGVTYVSWSPDARRTTEVEKDRGSLVYPEKYEMSFDFTYSMAVTKWMFIQPDIQFIMNPGGTAKVPNALVIGSRFKIIF
ncbi:MAG: carbohydrate porin [Candidatus Omnitrophica bacterium]|nr:carbohydrate porin [Candidatus Omnitrophota bacterium]